jgi:DNA-binding NarL/FixJ family response regulator
MAASAHISPDAAPLRIRALVMNDNPAELAAVASLLETDPRIDVIGTLRDVSVGVRAAVKYAPDLIVMRVDPPDFVNVHIMLSLKQRLPGTKIILLGDCHYPGLNTGIGGYSADAFLLNTRLTTECRPQLVRLFPPSNVSD